MQEVKYVHYIHINIEIHTKPMICRLPMRNPVAAPVVSEEFDAYINVDPIYLM